jgi:hypothetical protein
MISSLKSADGSCGAYIGAIGERQAILYRPTGGSKPELQQFHEDEPFLQPASHFRSASQG